MLTAHVSRDPPPLAEVAPDLQVPPGLEAVIQRGLAKVSAERISSALEYAAALDDIARSVGYELPMMPRVSGQLAIPSGPHSISTPSPGFMSTPPPMAYSTPVPGMHQTPPPGMHQTPFPSNTPFPGTTPVPGDIGHAATQSLESLPKAARLASLAEVANEPLPKKYKVAALLIVLVSIALAGYLLFGRGAANQGTDTQIVTVPVGVPIDDETRLKAALHDLENGKTCADRKAAIPSLQQVGGERAIAALKKARYRMRGGVLGMGDSNTNACLKSEAERAIQALGGSLR